MQNTAQQNALFTEMTDNESTKISGGGFFWTIARPLLRYSINQWFAYSNRTDPYRDANGRINTSYDPYDRR